MKPIYRCDFCSQMGTAEEIMAHEENCYWNHNRRSCYTCKYREMQTLARYKCMLEVEIPENHIIKYCDKWEWNKRDMSKIGVSNIFGNLFEL